MYQTLAVVLSLLRLFEGATSNPTYRKSTGQLSLGQEDVVGLGLDARQHALRSWLASTAPENPKTVNPQSRPDGQFSVECQKPYLGLSQLCYVSVGPGLGGDGASFSVRQFE